MWDIMSIIAENNRQAIQWMMGGQRVARAELQQPGSLPLQVLAEKLKVGPPLLSELVNGFTEIEAMERFLSLIRTHLPDHEEEIMMEGPRNRRVHRFCQLFSKQYFPLPSFSNTINMRDFSIYLPLELKGMSYEAYHELEMRPGYLMLLALVVYPYEGDERDEEERAWRAGERPRMTAFGDELWAHEVGEDVPPEGKTLMEIFSGARVPLLDKVQRIAGDVVLRITKDGWTAQELHQMTDGSDYDGVGDFADWAMQETGCIILDTNYADVDYVEGMREPLFLWTDWNVETLADEWPKAKQIREKIDRMVEWLEVDPRHRFEELVGFLEKRYLLQKPPKKKKQEERYYDPTDHWCPLQQLTDEDELYEIEGELEREGDYYGSEAEGGRTVTIIEGDNRREITAEQFISGRY